MLSDLPQPLRDFYLRMQDCMVCPLGHLKINEPWPRNWRLHGWGRNSRIIFVAMNIGGRAARARTSAPNTRLWAVYEYQPTKAKLQNCDEATVIDEERQIIYVLELGGKVAMNDAPFLLALHRLGLKREEVFVTNVVKCDTPDKLTLERYSKEIETCRRVILDEEIRILSESLNPPESIICMGMPAWHGFNLHQRGQTREMLIAGRKVRISAIYHSGYYNRKGVFKRSNGCLSIDNRLLREHIEQISVAIK